MQRFNLICGSLLLLLASSCTSIELLSIDYMVPADISYPASLRRVAVVNNVPAIPDSLLLITAQKGAPAIEDGWKVTEHTDKKFWGDPQLTTEALAEALAEGNYFDQVIICDSALRQHDALPQSRKLTMSETNRLAEELGADFLVALEAIQIQAVRKTGPTAWSGGYYGTVDAKVTPLIRLYVPHRQEAIATFQSTDSIFWEKAESTEGMVKETLPTDADIRKEASLFGGSIPVSHLVPHWQKGNRYLLGAGSVGMRDALVFAHESNWNEAIKLWEAEYEKKGNKKKMAAAHNLALAYEMLDNLEKAYEWANKAHALTDGTNPNSPYYVMTGLYVHELEQRIQGLSSLKLQTERFD